jgi:hypothetical protein
MAFENLQEEITQEFAQFSISPHENLLEKRRTFTSKKRRGVSGGGDDSEVVSARLHDRDRDLAALDREARLATKGKYPTHCICGRRINGRMDEPFQRGESPAKFCSLDCRKTAYYAKRKTGCSQAGCPQLAEDHGLCSLHVKSPPGKECATCREKKSVMEFYQHPHAAGGYSFECKVCARRRQYARVAARQQAVAS